MKLMACSFLSQRNAKNFAKIAKKNEVVRALKTLSFSNSGGIT